MPFSAIKPTKWNHYKNYTINNYIALDLTSSMENGSKTLLNDCKNVSKIDHILNIFNLTAINI